MSVDRWLNLNAITYLAASSRKRDYFILLGCAYVRKYPLSVGQERKMPVIFRKKHWRSKGDWMQRQRRLNSDAEQELYNCPCLLIFPLWRLSGQWLSSFGPCSVIMVSLCDSRIASAAAKGQKVLLCLDICWEKSELSFSLSIWFSCQRPCLSFLYLLPLSPPTPLPWAFVPSKPDDQAQVKSAYAISCIAQVNMFPLMADYGPGLKCILPLAELGWVILKNWKALLKSIWPLHSGDQAGLVPGWVSS